jgi:hypothetical protein
VGIWDLDAEQAEQQRELLLTHIAPSVRNAPGLVKGYWAGETGQRSHTFVVFEDERSAEAFASNVRGNQPAQADSGVGAMDLRVVPIAAET